MLRLPNRCHPALQVHPNARKKKAPPKPGSEEEADMHREQADAALRHDYQQGGWVGRAFCRTVTPHGMLPSMAGASIGLLSARTVA